MKKTETTLMASDPRSYRQVVAVAVKELRPEIEVWISEPADPEREIPRLNRDRPFSVRHLRSMHLHQA